MKNELNTSGSDREKRGRTLLQRFFENTITQAEAAELLAYWNALPEEKAQARRHFQVDRSLKLLHDREATLSVEQFEHLKSLARTRFGLSNLQEKTGLDLDENLNIEKKTQLHEYDTSLRPSSNQSEKRFPKTWTFLALTSMLLFLVLVGAWWIGSDPLSNQVADLQTDDSNQPATLARFVRLTNAQWTDQTKDIFEWTDITKGERFQLASGSIEIAFDVGVHLVIEGPAEMTVIDSKRVKIQYGKFAARVARTGIGFTIDTPSGVIVDQGTAFGVDVAKSGGTKVLVYDGMIDVYHQPDKNDPSTFAMDAKPVTLNTGEGLLFRQNGQSEPISAIGSDYFLSAAIPRPPKSLMSQSVIISVRDNIRDSSMKFYEIVPKGFGEDVRAYVDRLHEWNGVTSEGLPEFLVGGDMIRTFNSDKLVDDYRLTINLSAPARLFVLLDKRSTVPEWLQRDYTKTEYVVGLDEAVYPHEYDSHYDWAKLTKPEERMPSNLNSRCTCATGPSQSVDFIFSVWERKSTDTGEVVLGALPFKEGSDRKRQSFYGIVAVPLHSNGI